jgi:hypothetical protein
MTDGAGHGHAEGVGWHRPAETGRPEVVMPAPAARATIVRILVVVVLGILLASAPAVGADRDGQQAAVRGHSTGPATAPPFDPNNPPFAAWWFPLQEVGWERLYPHDRKLPPVIPSAPVDANGVPLRWEAGALHYTPSGIAIEALRRLSAYHRTWDPAYLEVVRACAAKLREMMVEIEGALWIPMPWNNPGQRLAAPWYNGLAQGTALALFSRLYRLSGDPSDYEVAAGLFRSFLVLGPSTGPWVSRVDPATGLLWIEHYPGGWRGRVLNAHLFAALGLRDFWHVTGSDEARAMTNAAFTTVRVQGIAYRRPGTWSWYNLDRAVAYKKYHRMVVRQLRDSTVATGDGWFWWLADVLAGDWSPG